MIVIKSVAEYAATVRRVASEQKLYRPETISDLIEAASILEMLAAHPDGIAIEAMPQNILEDEA